MLGGCPGPMPLLSAQLPMEPMNTALVTPVMRPPGIPGPTPTPGQPESVVSTYSGFDIGHIDGPRETARFAYPTGLAFDARGNLYVGADMVDHSVRKITPAGEVVALAGDLEGYADGPAADARFRSPRGLAIDSAGNVYVADSGNNRIRKIDTTGTVSTVAGGWSGYKDGPAAEAQFNSPWDVAIDPAGDLLVADMGNNRIRRLTPQGVVSTIAGSGSGDSDGPALQAEFSRPAALAPDRHGNLFVVDRDNGSVRKIGQDGAVSTVAKIEASISFGGSSTGPGLGGWTWSGPNDLAVGSDGTLYVAVSMRIYKIPAGTAIPIAIAGYSYDTAPDHKVITGTADGPGLEARFAGANSLALGPDGALYVGDLGNHRIRRIVLPK